MSLFSFSRICPLSFNLVYMYWVLELQITKYMHNIQARRYKLKVLISLIQLVETEVLGFCQALCFHSGAFVIKAAIFHDHI